MEMGEFSNFRRPLLIILPVGFLLVLRFVDEFLAVRALGILCLLAAEPLLDAAFLRPEDEPIARHGARLSHDCGGIDLGDDAIFAPRPDRLEHQKPGALAASFRSRLCLWRGDPGLCVRLLSERRPFVLVILSRVDGEGPSIRSPRLLLPRARGLQLRGPSRSARLRMTRFVWPN